MKPLKHQSPESLAKLERVAQRMDWEQVKHSVRDAQQVRLANK